ncbi:bifunctional UDP-sugar hydrolase/5'-nucleotidase [Providencia rettgeri]|uniref:bifunctional metallophosphatase/5'-nucleotidase n=1 Tax=Providencia rettgeri TaxID=587 RepID=UPI001EFDA78A|nr:bifunctional UDP-sugar hydrolase/5'-nucleotidase [Providencia rettgeri]MCG9528952.1 bifunctional metallophosphatase/5'-nucleotidase [Providencia rettgeri]
MNKKLLVLPIIIGSLLGSTLSYAKDIIIYHTNDLHAHVSPFKVPYISKDRQVGGFANIASVVKDAKNKEQGVFFFDAGDYFTGPYISTLTNGEAVVDIMNEMSFDAVSIGNHEFDHGVPNMLTQLNKAKFPVLLGNVFYENSEKPVWDKPWTIIEKDGVKLGVIGLHGKFAFYDTVNKDKREGVEARDEVEYLQKYINELKDKVDITVLLVHEGVPARQSSFGATDVSRMLQKDIDLAKQVDGIDVLITGHAHVGTPEPIKVNDTLIVSTDSYGINLGKLVLDVDDNTNKIKGYKGQLINMFADEHTPDPATQKKIDDWTKKLETITLEKIGNANVELTRAYGESSLLGNLITDAFLQTDSRAKIAFVNSGGIRSEIEKGNITLGDVISMFPFPDELTYMEISGKDLRSLMNHAANLTNGVLQVSSGLEMKYDSKKNPDSRVVSLKLNGKDINDNEYYPIVVNSFLATGGDGFEAFNNGKNTKTIPGISAADAVIEFIKKQPNQNPKLDLRISDIASK